MGKRKYENLENQNIGIYKIIRECNYKAKNGYRVFYVKCSQCGWEGEKDLRSILESKQCRHQCVEPNNTTEIGIYKNIRKSEHKSTDGIHALYYAECKVCGKTVERTLYDLRHFNTICQHGQGFGQNISFEIIPSAKDYSEEDNQYHKRVYDMWRHMLLRTTKSFWEKYPCYEGTTVSSDWLSFDKFYEDIKELPGYEEWKQNYGQRYMLDKDVLGNGRKYYSKETCCFLSPAESNKDVASRHPEKLEKFQEGSKKYKEEISRKVKATNKKTGEVKFFNSMKECADALNDLPSHIWMCLSDDPKYISHKSSKGWSFEEIK